MNYTPKDRILNQISEYEIMKHYIPEYSPHVNRNYRSPFSEKDDHPSLHIYEENGRLLFKSHNTGHQGDVFQLVADLKGIDCKSNFTEVLNIIKQDLAIEDNYNKSAAIQYEDPGSAMIQYFANLGVDAELLKRYKVQQVSQHEFYNKKGKLCKFDYKRYRQLAICYQIQDRIKIYIPEIKGQQEKTFGFKNQVATDVFGWEQLPNEPIKQLFITAGEKDCLVLVSRKYNAISFQSETIIPPTQFIEAINQKAQQVLIVYDQDKEGNKSSKRLAQQTGWLQVYLTEGTKDVTDYFQKYATSDFELLIQQATPYEQDLPKEKVITVFHQTEAFLSKHYQFRYNTISLDIEVSLKGQNNFKQANENQLFITVNKAGIKVGMDKLICILRSDFVPHYNPITAYFKQLPTWDGVDHIGKLASYLHCDRAKELEQQFRKWLVRSVRCAIEPSYYNKQAFILVHNKQNSGKTSFCRFLCPPALTNYMAENISDDKDSRIALVKNFLINLDELSSLARHEINSLKALFSKDCINERLPYDRKNSIIPRVANFIGSTNMGEFLTDETGSVRWLCFEITGINWAYRQEVDINKVWAQAYSLYKTGFNAEMSIDDISENEQRNAKFQQRSVEAEIIPTLLLPGDNNDPDSTFMTATDILNYLTIYTSLKLNRIMIGRAMPFCKFTRVKDKTSDRYGYYCKKLRDNQ